MSNEITVTTSGGELIDFTASFEHAKTLMEGSRAENTRRAYRASWTAFEVWCRPRGLTPLPASPAVIGVFLSDCERAGLKASTLNIRLASIVAQHADAGHLINTKAPEIARIMRGARRKNGVAPVKKAAVVRDVLRDSVKAFAAGDTLKDKRNRALLTVGFFGALRRSELVSIDIEHLTFTDEGVILLLPRSKTDQEGQGVILGLPRKDDPLLCPVRALQDWLAASVIQSGPVFRAVTRHDTLRGGRLGDDVVADVVKAATAAAGHTTEDYSGHSLRAGFVTSAARAGIAEHRIMAQSRHRSTAVLRGYIRREGLFRDNAAADI